MTLSLAECREAQPTSSSAAMPESPSERLILGAARTKSTPRECGLRYVGGAEWLMQGISLLAIMPR